MFILLKQELDFLFYCILHERCYRYFFSTSLQDIYENKHSEWNKILLKKEKFKALYFSFLNVNGDHWVFIILNFNKRKFVVFDSSPTVSNFKLENFAQNIKNYLKFRDNNLGGLSSTKDYSWVGFYGECSKQNDSNNCGIFVIEVRLLAFIKIILKLFFKMFDQILGFYV